MKVAVFNTKSYDKEFLCLSNANYHHDLTFFEPHLSLETAPLAAGYPAICVFVNDILDASVLQTLSQQGTKLIALRCAGYNNVDLEAAQSLGMTVVRVPAYSPYAVAEYTVGMMLDLNRKIHRAYSRVREGNFSLEGLLGFDFYGKTVGILGIGKIGAIVCRILNGFGCKVLAFDPYAKPAIQEELDLRLVSKEALFAESDIISLHCPLTPETFHIIDAHSIEQMKPGVMLINTSRGAVIDTRAVIEGLKSGKIGTLGMDVYEEEGDLFFQDLSCQVIKDDVFTRLLTFPNVLITGHQAFFTKEALTHISETTLSNISDIEAGRPCPNQIKAEASYAVAATASSGH